MRYPGTPRQRLAIVLILAIGLLIVDGVRKRWFTANDEGRVSPGETKPAESVPPSAVPPEKPPQRSSPSRGGEAIGPAESPMSSYWPWGPFFVEVRGRQFHWHYRMPGVDGVLHTPDDRFSIDELHVPIGVDVAMTVNSDDYVYTYSVPGLALRRIAVPELTYPLEFRGVETACYDVVADPLCRVRIYHGDLMGRIVVDDWPEFSAWCNALPVRSPSN